MKKRLVAGLIFGVLMFGGVAQAQTWPVVFVGEEYNLFSDTRTSVHGTGEITVQRSGTDATVNFRILTNTGNSDSLTYNENFTGIGRTQGFAANSASVSSYNDLITGFVDSGNTISGTLITADIYMGGQNTNACVYRFSSDAQKIPGITSFDSSSQVHIPHIEVGGTKFDVTIAPPYNIISATVK